MKGGVKRRLGTSTQNLRMGVMGKSLAPSGPGRKGEWEDPKPEDEGGEWRWSLRNWGEGQG